MIYSDSVNKGDRGFLTIIAGSRFYRGAASLAVRAALRCGVGIVRLASIEPVIESVAAMVEECIYLPLGENNLGAISALNFPFDNINSSAILIGSGMTKGKDTEDIVKALLKTHCCPIILDADALNSITEDLDVLSSSACDITITPHIGEMSRLTKLSVSEIKGRREEVALDFAKRYKITVVLKDSETVVASRDGDVFRYNHPNSGLAKGGSGDVLSGIIASLLAQGGDSFSTACRGVSIHGEAGRIASVRYSKDAMLPSDIIACLSDVFLLEK